MYFNIINRKVMWLKKSSLPIQYQQDSQTWGLVNWENLFNQNKSIVKQCVCETVQLFNSMDMEQHSLEQAGWGSPRKEAAVSQLPCHSSAQTRQLHFAPARQLLSSVTASARETQFSMETKCAPRDRGEIDAVSHPCPRLVHFYANENSKYSRFAWSK